MAATLPMPESLRRMVELKLVNSTSPMVFTSPTTNWCHAMFAGESQKPKGEAEQQRQKPASPPSQPRR